MIVPSIDLRGAKAVQLQQGQRQVLERDDVFALAERFGRLGEIAVIDLDAALGTGDNLDLVLELCRVARCRVGGGIRDAQRALRLLRGGASSVIVGTAATPDLLAKLPRERTIVALDERGGCVSVEGWQRTEDETPEARAERLEPYCNGFLATQIEREGMLGGIDLARARALRERLPGALTVAGGVRSVEEVVALDRLRIDVQVGMAIYTGAFEPEEAFTACVNFSKGLVPTVVRDARDGSVRMLAYSSPESLAAALREGAGVYFSRSRNELWRKGETSGARQRLIRAELDCDRDALVFHVEQSGATCHTGQARCFPGGSFSWPALLERIEQRAASSDARSYTRALIADPALLRAKLLEEAQEAAEAVTRDEVAWECADVLYFLSVRMHAAGIGIEDVMAQLASRAR